jgi:hypothetical protein
MTTPFLNLKTGSLPTGCLRILIDDDVFILPDRRIQDKVESMLYRTSSINLTEEQKKRAATIVKKIPNFWSVLRDFNAEYHMDGKIHKDVYENVYYPWMTMNEYPSNTRAAEVKDAERSKGSLTPDEIIALTRDRR